MITGGAGGIGFALARAFAARGAQLVLADLDEAGLAARARELEADGARVLAVPTDVTRRESLSALADATWGRFGGCHLLCNNAGIAILGPLLDARPEDWRLTMDVNFWGVVHGVEAFVPRMIEQGEGGHVVNTASMAGLVGMQGLGVYCASKFAVVGLSESLQRELAAHRIGVSVLCPMIVATRIGENSARLRAGQLPDAAPIVSPPADQMRGGVITAEDAALRVVRAVERGDLYVLTHREQREFLRRRWARQDALFEPERWEHQEGDSGSRPPS